MNRRQKSWKDAGEWMPRMNRCWFAGWVVAVKRKYGLSVDAREARALEGVLSECASTEMVMAEGQAQVAESTPRAGAPSTDDALSRRDTNGNGGLHAARPASTASRRCTGSTRRTDSCGTGVETG